MVIQSPFDYVIVCISIDKIIFFLCSPAEKYSSSSCSYKELCIPLCVLEEGQPSPIRRQSKGKADVSIGPRPTGVHRASQMFGPTVFSSDEESKVTRVMEDLTALNGANKYNFLKQESQFG